MIEREDRGEASRSSLFPVVRNEMGGRLERWRDEKGGNETQQFR